MRAVCLLMFAALGCGGTGAMAAARAERELACRPPALRVQPIGELVARGGAPRVQLFDASGCEREQLYLCVDEPEPRCVTRIADLSTVQQTAGIARALHLLRTTARARCPESELRVVQESESLYRYEACDGTWLYHCRARRCQRL